MSLFLGFLNRTDSIHWHNETPSKRSAIITQQKFNYFILLKKTALPYCFMTSFSTYKAELALNPSHDRRIDFRWERITNCYLVMIKIFECNYE